MSKKLIVLLLAMCITLSGCGLHPARLNAIKDKLLGRSNDRYSQSYDVDDYDDWDDDDYYDDYEDEYEDAYVGEEASEESSLPSNLQTYQYTSYIEGCTDFSISYDGDILSVCDYWDTPAAYLWSNRDLDNPHAYMHARYGSWEDHYADPYTRYVLNANNKKEVSEPTPLSINGYDGYYWTIRMEESAINWTNDLYIFAVQIDAEHYFYVESSRLTLNDICTFEELLSDLLYNIEIQ